MQGIGVNSLDQIGEKEVIGFFFSDGVQKFGHSYRRKVNPKRQLREAMKQIQSQGIGTKSQQALKLQQEQKKSEREQRSKAERMAAKELIAENAL